MARRRGPTKAGLRSTLVRDAMSRSIVTCSPDLPIARVAELMSTHGIHSVVVIQPRADDAAPAHRRWGVLSDLDLVAVAPWGEGQGATAGDVATSPQAVIRSGDNLEAAALLMAEYRTAHLLVIEDGADEPVGILSGLDVVRALSGSETVPACEKCGETPSAGATATAVDPITHCEWCGAEYPVPAEG
jgi:signal-transduction protein with cAMP-binding, CBS, and nucleotidyltransferase domain